MEVHSDSIANEALPSTLKQGLITIIPKPPKYLLLVDNWRPICLLNNDYKLIIALVVAKWRALLDAIIDESQSGFMRNRHISNNVRLVLDIIDYSDLVSDESFILFGFV